jgi:hypothetical protein
LIYWTAERKFLEDFNLQQHRSKNYKCRVWNTFSETSATHPK